MFDLSAAWWEIPLRVTLIYVALLALVRLSGKRTVGQFTPFDLLVVMLLSETVSQGLNGGDESVTGAVIGAAMLVLLNVLVAVVTARSARARDLLEGQAVLLGSDGRFFGDRLRENHVPPEDVQRSLREADCDLKDMKRAYLEADGQISILKDSTGQVDWRDSD